MTETQKDFFIREFILSLVLTCLYIFLARILPEGFIQIICIIFCAICALCSIIIVIVFLSDYNSKGNIEIRTRDSDLGENKNDD